jgi:hypothetical protein
MERASHKLKIGLTGKVGAFPGATIRQPLLARILIEMDPDTGELIIVPDGPLSLETEPLQGLDLSASDELAALRDQLRISLPNPWTPDGLAEAYRQAVAPLGLDGRIETGVTWCVRGPARCSPTPGRCSSTPGLHGISVSTRSSGRPHRHTKGPTDHPHHGRNAPVR